MEEERKERREREAGRKGTVKGGRKRDKTELHEEQIWEH